MAEGQDTRVGQVAEDAPVNMGGAGQGVTGRGVSDGSSPTGSAGDARNILPRGIEQSLADLMQLITMSSRSNKPDGDSESSLDLIERVGGEATKSTIARMGRQEPEPPKELTPDELALSYGLEPTTIENLKESQAAYKKIGSDLTLEQVYFLEFDQPE